MKSNSDLAKEIVGKAKEKRIKKRWIAVSISSFVVALFCFFVGFSNILTIEITRFEDSYRNYLKPYVTAEADVALRIVDDKNAVVSVENQAYPCKIKATSKSDFKLTVVDGGDEKEEDAPSVFRVEFWDTNATVEWEILGVKVKKVLSLTTEWNIPAGLWSHFSPQSGNDGAGWTLILENGDSYTGEGMDSAWRSKFVSVGNQLFQCLFDPKSGVIVDASVFDYDDTSFDFPVIKERYLSDGDDDYAFYSKLLTDEQKIDFTGGSFNASVIATGSEVYRTSKGDLLDESVAKWQLTGEKSKEFSRIKTKAALTLNENGSVTLKIKGSEKYEGSFKGKWYPLRHSVLVVLDKRSALTGKVFTLFARSDTREYTGESIEKYAISRIDSTDYYKTGYHTFDYFVVESSAMICWGSEMTEAEIFPELQYEREYVLNGKYYYEFFDGDYESCTPSAFDPSALVDLPVNGTTFVFHEDGTVTISYPNRGEETEEFEIEDYTSNFQGKRVKIGDGYSYSWLLYVGDNYWRWDDPKHPSKARDFRIDVPYFEMTANGLNFVYKREQEENGETYEVIYYILYFDLK